MMSTLAFYAGLDLVLECARRPAAPPDRGRGDRDAARRSRASCRRRRGATARARCPWTTRSCRWRSTLAGGRATGARCPRPLYDHWMRSFAMQSKSTLHVRVLRGTGSPPRRRGGVQGARPVAARGARRIRDALQHEGRRRRGAKANADAPRHRLPRRDGRPRREGRAAFGNCATSASPRSWRSATNARAPTRSCSSTSPPRARAAPRSWTSCGARPSGSSCRSPWAAASARSTTARGVLRAGADKVSLNSAAVERPESIGELSARFGAQCVVASIDAKLEQGTWRVYTHGGTRRANLEAVAWARECVRRGAGEILLTSIDRDGAALRLRPRTDPRGRRPR